MNEEDFLEAVLAADSLAMLDGRSGDGFRGDGFGGLRFLDKIIDMCFENGLSNEETHDAIMKFGPRCQTLKGQVLRWRLVENIEARRLGRGQ